MIQASKRSGWVVILAAVVVAGLAAPSFLSMHKPDVLHPGDGVTRQTLLSEYFPAIAGTAGDTPVFILDSKSPGGCMLVLGGTHGDETAGYLAAVTLLENAKVQTGRVILIPRANASGFTHNVAQEAHPQRIVISTPHGARSFTVGARYTNPIHQWPDPQVYTHVASGQSLSGPETRNLNRSYPGRAEGTFTERIAFAITELIRKEKVDLAIDLHEAAPEYPVVNTIVAHERAMDLAAMVNMNLQAMDIPIGMEASPKNFHGLSHREWGDATSVLAILMESTSPGQGRLRGRTDAALITQGKDRFYVLASERHRLSVPYPESGWPLEMRVGRHVAAVNEFAKNLGDFAPDKTITMTGVPEYQAMLAQGVGAFLK